MRRLLLGFAILTTFFTFTAITPLAAYAQAEGEGLIIECDRIGADGKLANADRCGIEDFVAQFVRLAQWGLTIVVFLAVLMFVYGGFEFITAGGRQSKISSGQNIISGTVIGLAISMSAYVIINFSVGAITGTKTSTNPFTAISTVFGGRTIDDAPITKPFSGVDDQAGTPKCRTTWNTTCDSEIFCADEAQVGLSGPVASYQSRLDGLGCGCGIDGCYGKDTTQCVRRFQVANNLIITGTITEQTKTAMEQQTAQRCDDPLNTPRITSVLNALPSTVLPSSSVPTEIGCCVIQSSVSGEATPLYCLNDVSERSCAALGAGYVFAKGKQCAKEDPTKTLCGFCRSVDNFCFQETGKYWCENIVKDPDSNIPYTFQQGVCMGLGGVTCSGECVETLKTLR